MIDGHGLARHQSFDFGCWQFAALITFSNNIGQFVVHRSAMKRALQYMRLHSRYVFYADQLLERIEQDAFPVSACSNVKWQTVRG